MLAFLCRFQHNEPYRNECKMKPHQLERMENENEGIFNPV